VITDGHGTPLAVLLTGGNPNDVTHRGQVSDLRALPAIARRGTRHGTGLDTCRLVIERSIAWLHGFRRLRIRWERRADIHEAFLKLACSLITHRQLGSSRQPLHEVVSVGAGVALRGSGRVPGFAVPAGHLLLRCGRCF
jgi:transposase